LIFELDIILDNILFITINLFNNSSLKGYDFENLQSSKKYSVSSASLAAISIYE